MLRDNAGITNLRKLEQVPIPVDIHVARSTLALGIVRGQYKGSLLSLFDDIRQAWFSGVAGLQAVNRPMIALDVDEPLWHLSKYGCTNRDKQSGVCPLIKSCEMRSYCVPGAINLTKGHAEVDI